MGKAPSRPGRPLVVLAAAGMILAGGLASITPGPAFAGPHEDAVMHGQRRGPAVAPATPDVLRARAALADSIGSGVLVDTDPYLGAVRWVANLDGTLTGPSGLAPQDVALGFLRDHLDAFGLTPTDVDLLSFRDDYVDILGTHQLSWVQVVVREPVFRAVLKAAVEADGSLIAMIGPVYHVVRDPARTGPTLTAAEAIHATEASAGVEARRAPPIPGPRDRATLVRFPTQGNTQLAWATITTISPSRIDRAVIDAASGRVLWRENLVKADQPGSGLAWPHAPSPLLPNGGGVQGPVTFPVAGPEALSGNNAHVFTATPGDDAIHPRDEIPALDALTLDWGQPAVLDSAIPSQNCRPSTPCTWDANDPYSWRVNRRQEAIQAYYLLNTYHDHLEGAPIGFTEAAGNFQAVNDDGLGGQGGDAVRAETLVGANLAHDGRPRLLNNATMYTPPDGNAGWMSLYLFRATRSHPNIPSGDAADDASVVFHEYTHGLSSRLVTMPDGSEALYGQQSGALSEGWSDWYALDALVGAGYQADAPSKTDVPMGVWIAGGEGVRFQFADCQVEARSPHCPDTPGGAGPGGLTYADFGHVATRPEEHSDGEIWLQTLWQLRRELGSAVTETLTTRAMELSPQAPTFVDMRNAILVADAAIFGSAHHDAIWQVFASRGMGFFASATDTFDTDPVADFSTPVDCPGPGCGSLSGRVTDPSGGGAPVAGALVRVAGSELGVPVDLSVMTGPDGRFHIPDVPDGLYRDVEVSLAGYATRTFAHVRVDGAATMRIILRRDWASLAGGASIVRFTGPDHTGVAGECGPAAAVDDSRTTSWLTSAARPRSLTIRLPQRVDISTFAVDPSAICAGSFSDAKAFDVWTRSAGGPWVLAYRTHDGLPAHQLTPVRPRAGSRAVTRVRLVLRTAVRSHAQVEFTELVVRGRAADLPLSSAGR